MKKRVLVTGAAGFIGSHVVDKLLARGTAVFGVDNFSPYYAETRKQENLVEALKNHLFSLHRIDIRDRSRLVSLVKKVRPWTIIHLAAEVGVRPSFERTAEYIETNIRGTQNVLAAAKESGIKHLVFGSSSSVYGKRHGSSGFKETDRTLPISPYAVTKLSAEQLARVHSSRYNLPITVLRFFTVYGPRNRPDMAMYRFTEAISRGKPIVLFGKGTKRDFTFIDDVVDGIIRAVERPRGFRIINLGNHKPVTVLNLVRLLEKLIVKRALVSHQPLPPGDVPVTFANVNQAKRLLGWEPRTSLKRGLRTLVEWYKKD
ncbi:MAG: GDP-mannose 4,6-dehydratase [Candidatus Chisholmbacteria bacterium]|nr:GDP-mannose 4,6-dehydratase [Candidatus Chisholmbacteria bacterium]